MCVAGPSAPSQPPLPPPRQPATPAQSTASAEARDREARRRRAAFGPSSTLLTGGSGVTGSANTGGKVLLGQ